jgi:hypothetical protein
VSQLRPKHFSWSALEKFESCPRAWRHKYIDKLPDPKGPALERGIKIHEALEIAIGSGMEVEFGGQWLGNQVDLYRSFKAVAEASVYVDRRWRELPAEADRFMPRDTYTMAKLDVLAWNENFFADWKSGKIRPKHEEQAELYAGILYLTSGKPRWDVDLVYVDQQHVEQLAFEFDSREAVMEKWERRSRPLFEATEWPKQPSGLCNYCPFHRSKSGPCDGKK